MIRLNTNNDVHYLVVIMSDPVYQIQKAKRDLERCGWYVMIRKSDPDGFNYYVAQEKIHLSLGLAKIHGWANNMDNLAISLVELVLEELGEDSFAAVRDLEVLSSNLSALERSLFGN